MSYLTKSYLQTQFKNFEQKILGVFAKKKDVPTKTSQLENDNITPNSIGALPKSGGDMTGGINWIGDQGLYWKERDYPDAFQIIPSFSGTGDNNILKIQGSVGERAEEVNFSNLLTLSAKSGNMVVKGSVKASEFLGNASSASYAESAGKSSTSDSASTASKVENALTFTGGASGSYDGSAPKSVAIPSYSQAPDTNGSNTLGLMSGDDRYRLLHELLALTGGTISGNLTVNGNLAGSAALTTPEQVAANTVAGKFASAVAVKTMANNMGVSVKDGKLVWTNAWGADTEIPFSSSKEMKILVKQNPPITYTFDRDYSNIIIASGVYEGSFTTKTLNDIPFGMDATIQAGGPWGMSCKLLHDIKKDDVLKLDGGGLLTVIYG